MTQIYNEDGLTVDQIATLLVVHCGFPTFDEFKKNPDKWRRDKEEMFVAIDRGSSVKTDKKQIYYWKDLYRCSSLEQAQRIALDEGYTASDLQEEPIRRTRQGSSSAQDTEVIVRLWPKEEFRRRGGVIFE
jgi:hypothetical protein